MLTKYFFNTKLHRSILYWYKLNRRNNARDAIVRGAELFLSRLLLHSVTLYITQKLV